MMETPESIHAFWFGSSPDDAAVAREKSSLWWKKSPESDERIRQRFEPVAAKAAQRELDGWAATPRGRLALILVTDQFPRNIYRDTAQAFSFDPLAQAWCKAGIEDGSHIALRPIERVFHYLPLEHSESLQDQKLSVALYQDLMRAAAPQQRSTFDGFLNYALRHHDIIERFGRFPHRNRILGRRSSADELAFLKERGSSF